MGGHIRANDLDRDSDDRGDDVGDGDAVGTLLRDRPLPQTHPSKLNVRPIGLTK